MKFVHEAARVADEVIAACKLPIGCRGTIIGGLVEMYKLGVDIERARCLGVVERYEGHSCDAYEAVRDGEAAP